MADAGIDLDAVNSRREFARRLTELREQAGLTVRDVARAVGLPDSTVGGYFAGRHLPPVRSPRLLPAILHLCGVTEGDEVRRWVDTLHRIRRAPGPRPGSATTPYRGLASFQPEDADWFYGREALTADLVQRLTEQHRTGPVLVIGPSGSGKSSLLRAGLIPALEAWTPAWQVLLFTPGDDPLRELAGQIAGRTGTDLADVHAGLLDDPAATVASAAAAGTRLLIVVDQFEEVFTTCRSTPVRTAFVAALAAATGTGDRHEPRPAVVLGLRADFYGDMLRDPLLAQAAQDDQFVVVPMNEAELRRAIVEPARKARFDVEDGLVELLLRDLTPPAGGADGAAAHEPGALPLLSHALAVTLEQSGRGQLTLAAYDGTGGIRAAVARSADEIYGSLTVAQQRAARQLFLRLVQVADDAADTRRRIPYSELIRGSGAANAAGTGPGDVEVVLDRYVERRLLTVDAETVDISHEALLLAWPRLRSWIDADRVGLRIHRQLTQAARQWTESGYDRQALYRGTRLATVQDWLAESGQLAGLSVLEERYVQQSAAHEAAERLAARRRSRLLQQLAVALATLLVISGGLAWLAFEQRTEANQDRDLAMSRQMAGAAEQLRRTDPNLAMQVAAAAYGVVPTAEARAALLDSYAAPVPTRLVSGAGVVQAVSVSRDGTLMATAGADPGIRLWNLTRGARAFAQPEVLTGHTDTVYALAMHPERRWVASGGGDRTVRLWDLDGAGPRVPALLPDLPGNTVYALAVSGDGNRLAAGSADGTVRMWDVSDVSRPVRAGPVLTVGAAIHAVAFSPDGHGVAGGAADATVRRWDVTDPSAPRSAGAPLSGFQRTVYGVAYSPNGRTLAAGSADGTVRRWDLTGADDPQPVGAPFTGPDSWVNSVTFSDDGQLLVAASSDNRAWIWNTATGRLAASLPHPGPVTAGIFLDHDRALATTAADGTTRLWQLPGPVIAGATKSVFNVAFNADDTVLMVAGGDDVVRLWDVADPRRPSLLGTPLSAPAGSGRLVGTADLSRDGRTLAAGGLDGTIHLWDLLDPRRPVLRASLTGFATQAESLAFSPDDDLLAAGGHDHTVRLWNLRGSTGPARVGPVLTGFTNYVFAVAFSPDGKILAAGGADRTVRLWNVADPANPGPFGEALTGHDNYVYSVTFSPDGRTLATGSADKSVQFWDVRDPARPQRIGEPLDGPNNYVYLVRFSPDGRTLAAATGDGGVWLWDVWDLRRPRRLAILAANPNTSYTVDFTRDGRWLAAGGSERTVRLWEADPSNAVAFICSVAGTPVTAREWGRHLPGVPYRPPCRP